MKNLFKLTIIILFLGSCSVQKELTLTEFNNSGYEVINYEFPWYEVMLTDSTTKFIYYPTNKPISKGFIIK